MEEELRERRNVFAFTHRSDKRQAYLFDKLNLLLSRFRLCSHTAVCATRNETFASGNALSSVDARNDNQVFRAGFETRFRYLILSANSASYETRFDSENATSF